MTEAEYAGLARSTQYAHYTPETIVRAVWAGLERLGFGGGRILEPGIGTGLFVALMPETVQPGSAVTGIEFDAISAGIARLLYPGAIIRHEDFARARLSGQYDLAIGNPPYSDRVARADPAYRALGLRLHDFFIAKAIDSLRPGGLAAFVTSTGTMDKMIRAPGTPWRARPTSWAPSASRKAVFARRPAPMSWWTCCSSRSATRAMRPLARPGTAPRSRRPGPKMPNRWPSTATGSSTPRWCWASTRWGAAGTVPATTTAAGQRPGADLSQALAEAIQRLPQALYTPRAHAADADDDDTLAFEPPSRVGTAADKALLKEGSFCLGQGGALLQILNRRAEVVKIREAGARAGLLPKQARILRALLPIRDAVRQVLRARPGPAVAGGAAPPADRLHEFRPCLRSPECHYNRRDPEPTDRRGDGTPIAGRTCKASSTTPIAGWSPRSRSTTWRPAAAAWGRSSPSG